MNRVYDWFPNWPAYVVTDNGQRSLYWTPDEWLTEIRRAAAECELQYLAMADVEGRVN